MELNSLKQNFHDIVVFWNTASRSVFMELVTKTLENEKFYFAKSYFNISFSENIKDTFN